MTLLSLSISPQIAYNKALMSMVYFIPSSQRKIALTAAQAEDEPVLVIGTHFAAPTAGHVRRDGDAFRFDVN